MASTKTPWNQIHSQNKDQHHVPQDFSGSKPGSSELSILEQASIEHQKDASETNKTQDRIITPASGLPVQAGESLFAQDYKEHQKMASNVTRQGDKITHGSAHVEPAKAGGSIFDEGEKIHQHEASSVHRQGDHITGGNLGPHHYTGY